MSKFGDLMGGVPAAAPEPVVPPTIEEPVYEAPGTPASVEPDIAPPVPPVTIDDLPDVPSTPAPTWDDLKNKSKYDLESKPLANIYTALVGGLLIYLIYNLTTKKQ